MMLCLAASSLLFLAQTATTLPATVPPDIATPNDGRETLALAAKVNGLHGMELPWHLKASYEVFGSDGNPSDKGTYEEWRISDKQYRVDLLGHTVATEEYGTANGVFRAGEQEWPRKPLSSIRGIIAQPVPPDIPEHAVFENFQKNSGAGKLPCTAVMKRGFDQTPRNSPSFCFTAVNAVLVYASALNQTYETEFEHIQLFHGHFVAFDIKQFLGGRPWLKIHVDSLEAFDAAHSSVLAVPRSALRVTPLLDLTGKLEQVHAINKVAPKYPATAKQKGIQGTVILNGVINKEGHIRGLRALAGPLALQQPALDAVSQWVYQPFLVDAQPVEVETNIVVEFRLRGLGYPLQ